MAKTDNLNLTLPGSNEYVDVEVLNENFRKIDDGTAPAGYGIGEEYATVVKNTDLDTLKNGGTYYIGTGCTNTPPNADPSWSTLHVIPGRACTQIFIPANDANRAGTFSSWIARIYNDKTAAWGEWEWVNPPMALSVEYRTTERYKGKAVCKKLDADGVIKWRVDGEDTWRTDKPISKSVTLSASGWDASAKTQTVTAAGVLADETKQLITPTPALASQTAYYEAGILITAQAVNSLTFTAKYVPETDLTVYVVIQEVYQG